MTPGSSPLRATDSADTVSIALDLTVVVPVYNEHHRLQQSLAAICGYLRDTEYDWELLVVDDGSTDDSAIVAATFAAHEPRVRALRCSRNRGKGHAVRQGVLVSRGNTVLYCDADLATPINELERLRQRLDAGFPAAIGSRATGRSHIEVKQPSVRVLLGRLGNRVIQTAAVPGVRDTQCGFKMFDGPKAREVFRLSKTNGWGFDVEILHLFAKHDWPIAEVPVRWAHRPGSKVGIWAYPRALSDVARIRLRHWRTP